MSLTVEYCGEEYAPDPERAFVVGREGDLVIDDNRHLHRRFLQITHRDGMWWLANVGARLAATVGDGEGRFEAWLAPHAHLPVVFPRTVVLFTAGPTTYELTLTLDEPAYLPPADHEPSDSATTVGAVSLTPDQRLLILALAEPALRDGVRGVATLPSNAAAAARLGWTLTRLNRKIDNVCERLARLGVRGLHGGPDRLATDRRSRLVEYALAARIVTREDLPLLDRRPPDRHVPTAAGRSGSDA